jgi:hypothetical protein
MSYLLRPTGWRVYVCGIFWFVEPSHHLSLNPAVLPRVTHRDILSKSSHGLPQHGLDRFFQNKNVVYVFSIMMIVSDFEAQ